MRTADPTVSAFLLLLAFTYVHLVLTQPLFAAIRYECLPTLFKTKYDSGVKGEMIYLNNPKEYVLQGPNYYLECTEAVVVTEYPESMVFHRGVLMVIFDKDLKIKIYEFQSKKHDEYFRKEMIVDDLNQLNTYQYQVNDIGLTPEFSRCLLTSEVIGENLISRQGRQSVLQTSLQEKSH
eukprot:TRINITY_DN6630_c0_g1_i1.p1 TRINITY_DN6630_c0_g1~~TRINITY_DN6630_c0_g1_i1.p1  ORF type:complete len:179 (+),score=25.74 TRINITY_DN6630_c0_g1_i1:232-768(+)